MLIGDSTVGKTWMVNRYVNDKEPERKTPTVGVEFSTKSVKLMDDTSVKAQIWDTAGQEKYRAITSAYILK